MDSPIYQHISQEIFWKSAVNKPGWEIELHAEAGLGRKYFSGGLNKYVVLWLM